MNCHGLLSSAFNFGGARGMTALTRSERGCRSGQKFPVRALFLPVHQDVAIGGSFLAIGCCLLFAYPVEPDDRCGAAHANRGVLIFPRQILRLSVGGISDKGRLVLDPAAGGALTPFCRAERAACPALY